MRTALPLLLSALLLALPACEASSTDDPAEGDPTPVEGGDETPVAEPEPEPEYFDQCVPGEAPDADCYATQREPTSSDVALATAIAERYMDLYPATDHHWDWSEAVLMFALTELSRVTGDPAPRAYAQAWLAHRIEKGYDVWWSDHCPPSLTAIALWLEDEDPTWLGVVEDVLEYVADVAPRTPEGGLGHLGTLDEDNPSLWTDTLMMVGMPLLRWSEAAGDEGAFDEAVLQGTVFTELLQGESGFYTHAHNWYTEQDPGLYWARGNGWIMVFLHELLRLRRLRGEEDELLSGAAAALTAGMLSVQDEGTGLWWGLLSHPGEIYLETSATALNAYGMARGYRYGWYGDDILAPLAAALDGLRSRIVDDDDGRPVVTGVSGPTSVGLYADYAAVELADDVPFGVGAAILALTEGSGLPPSPAR